MEWSGVERQETETETETGDVGPVWIPDQRVQRTEWVGGYASRLLIAERRTRGFYFACLLANLQALQYFTRKGGWHGKQVKRSQKIENKK